MKKIATFIVALCALVAVNAQTFVLQESFENGIPASWQNIDNDGDGFIWVVQSEPSYAPHTGSYSVTSASYDKPTSAVLHPDNWLITDAIAIPAISYPITLSWWDAAQDPNYPKDYYEVYISTTGNTIADFTDTAVFTKTLTTSTWTNETLDLSAYAGQNIYIAFVHTNCYDWFIMKIDDIEVYYYDKPTLVSTPKSVNFGTNFVNTNSAIQTININPVLISEDIVAKTNAPYELSLDSVSWSQTVNIPVANPSFMVRYSPAVTGINNDIVLLTASTAVDTVTLTGTAIDSCSLTPTDFQVLFADEYATELSWNALTNAGYTLEMIEENDTAWTTLFTDQTFSNPVYYTAPTQKGSVYQFRLKQHCIGDTIYSGYVYTNCMTPPFTGAFAHSAYPDTYLYRMDVNDPSNATPIWESPDGRTPFGGCYYDNKYYYVSSDKEFVVVDLSTLKETVLDTLPRAMRDMGYDYANDIMYGLEGDTLCTIDPNTGARLTAVGITGIDSNGAHVIAIDLQSTIYVIEYSTGKLYTLDAATGAATLVGNTGLSMAYIQAMTYDPNDGIIYWANYNSNGQLYTVDPTTAQTNLLGALCTSDGNEVGALFFPYTYNALAPAAPTLVVTPDPNMNAEAEVAVTNPTTDVNGDPFAGTIDSIIVTRDGEVIYVETVNTGVGATFTFTDNDPDLKKCVYYTYKAYAMTSEGKSQIAMQSVYFGDCCDFIVDMNDSYGDGWDNGNHAIQVFIDGDLRNTLSCSGAHETVNVLAENGSNVKIVWIVNTNATYVYPSEISFTIEDAWQQVVYAQCALGSAGSLTDGQVLATFTQNCDAPSCFKPLDLTITNITDVSAIVSWTDTVNSAWVVEYGAHGFTPGTGTTATTTTTSYTISGLTANTVYDVYVSTDCGDDGLSVALCDSIHSDLCPAEEKCQITVEMEDGYGDGWIYSLWGSIYGYPTISITSDGYLVDEFLLEDGYSETKTISICEYTEVNVYWNIYGEMDFADEISFKIYTGQGFLAYEISDATNLQDGELLTSFTNKCGVGVEENNNEPNVTIYPNPTKDILNVHAEGFNTVEVVNFLGQVVYASQVEGSAFQINTSNLTSGVYFLRLSGENVITKKFVKE
ncbi:MAG: choice-of-anchor J domain-containing protein [Bacteroidales bacterium]|nr:choice-of-anchor J domain-containing protein [Bacteroidales bacterium]